MKNPEVFIEDRGTTISLISPKIKTKKQEVISLIKSALKALEEQSPDSVYSNELIYVKETK